MSWYCAIPRGYVMYGPAQARASLEKVRNTGGKKFAIIRHFDQSKHLDTTYAVLTHDNPVWQDGLPIFG